MQLSKTDKWTFLASCVFALIGFPAAIPTLTSAIDSGDYLGALSIFLYIIILLVIIYKYRPHKKPQELPTLEFFSPFKKSAGKTHWKRKKDLEKLIKSVDKPANKITVVFGPSGAGKTIFIKNDLIPELEKENRKYLLVSCNNSFTSLPPEESISSGTTIILDQFEHLFITVEQQADIDSLKQTIAYVNKHLTNYLSKDNQVVICLREDKYYLLKYLDFDIPTINNSINIGKINKAEDKEAYEKIEKAIKSIIKSDFKFIESYSVTLLELQAHGALFELHERMEFDIKEISQKNHSINAVKNLLDLYLDYSPNKSVSTRILFSLNQKNLTSGLTIKELTKVIDAEYSTTKDCCEYLLEIGLISKFDEGIRFSISHDSLITAIEICSSERLRPFERDIIKNSIAGLPNVINLNMKDDGSSIFGQVIISIIGLMIIARLFFYEYDFWYFLPYSDKYLSTSFLDITYLPIALPHFLWCYYIALHDIKVYSNINENFLQRTLSIIVLLNLLLCILLGMFIPSLWIVSIGWGGMLYVLKTFGLSFDKRLSSEGKRILRSRSLRALFNMSITIIVGIIYYLIIDTSVNILYTYAVSFVFVITWLIMFELHISEIQARFLRGLLKYKLHKA